MTKRSEPAAPRPILFRDRAAWRRWLERHHGEVGELWLAYYKKHAGKRSVTYPEALDEALCFGWIDGMVRSIDDERYMQRWTPRKNPKGWSAANLAHVRRLLAEGRMTEAGLRVLGVPLEEGRRSSSLVLRSSSSERNGERPRPTPAGSERRTKYEERRTVEVPRFIATAIARNRAAAAFWDRLAPSHRRRYVAWIVDAKKEETRARRLAEAVRLLARGLKELMK